MTSSVRLSIASRNILLINPPSPPGCTANREGAGGLGTLGEGDTGFLYPPHMLATTAAVLSRQGWTVRLVDAAGERLDADRAVRLIQAQPEPIIAVQFAQISLETDIEFANRLRTAVPRARLLAVGASIPLIEPHLLERTDVDHVLIGEPEAVLLPLCQVLAGESNVRRLRRHVTAADVAAQGVDEAGRLLDLNRLPLPAWTLVPWQRYGFLTILTSRGCDDTCTFCPYVVGQGRHVRACSAQRVVDEMVWLATTFAPRRVIVRDPVFAHDRQRVEQICRALVTRKVALAWECESRPEHFDADLLRLMQRAGCSTIKLGLETTGERTLRILRRIQPTGSAEAYLRHTADIVAACQALGLACRLFVMTGLPGQKDDEVNKTIAFLRDTKPTAVHVKPFHRYPGLPMPPANTNEERERGERQARLLQAAFPAQQATTNPLRVARRWLAERMRR